MIVFLHLPVSILDINFYFFFLTLFFSWLSTFVIRKTYCLSYYILFLKGMSMSIPSSNLKIFFFKFRVLVSVISPSLNNYSSFIFINTAFSQLTSRHYNFHYSCSLIISLSFIISMIPSSLLNVHLPICL